MENRKDKIIIAIPCMETLEVAFVQSLEELYRVGHISTCFVPGSLVYHARNQIAEIANNTKVDYVLWIDSDMVFDSTLLVDLLADLDEHPDADMVAPICFRRRVPFNPVIYKKLRVGLKSSENEVEEYNDYPENDFFEVDACGFGCVLMRGGVLNAITCKYEKPFQPVPGFGEDLSFCIRAKELGARIFCDSRVKLGHVTRTVVTEDTFKKYRTAEGPHGNSSTDEAVAQNQ